MKQRSKKCMASGCTRPPYARGYCQSHYHQFMKSGATTAIRPYRPRDPLRIKFAGLSLLPATAQAVKGLAQERGISHSAVISAILERWASKRRGRS